VGLLLCTGGLFSGQGSYVVGLLLCTGGLFIGQGSYIVDLLLCTGAVYSGQGLLDILMTTTNFVLTSNTTGSRSLELFDAAIEGTVIV
jgi:hypothetical protein